MQRLTNVTYSQHDGTFELVGIASGAYRVVAVAELEADAWKDPAIFEQLFPLGTSTRIDWDEEQRLALTAMPAPVSAAP